MLSVAERDRDIRLLGEGKTYAEIARETGVTQGAIRLRNYNIYRIPYSHKRGAHDAGRRSADLRMIDTLIKAREIELLMAGKTPAEVAAETGATPGTIRARNQRIYGVDLQVAYRRKIEREGIPSRLGVDDAFGSWFSGFFDGEGHLGAYYHGRRLVLCAAITRRDDDTPMLRQIKSALKVGRVTPQPPRPPSAPCMIWICSKTSDLVEVIVPLLDKYPLRAKKALVYALWRSLAVDIYILRRGSHRVRLTEEQRANYQERALAIQSIRKYPTRGKEKP